MPYLNSRRARIAQDMSQILEQVAFLIQAQQSNDWKDFQNRCAEIVKWSKRAHKEARYLHDAAGQ